MIVEVGRCKWNAYTALECFLAAVPQSRDLTRSKIARSDAVAFRPEAEVRARR